MYRTYFGPLIKPVQFCYFIYFYSTLDTEAEIFGAPAAPLDVECLDANKDYVIISWKQPAVDGGSPILGYFIDRLILLMLINKYNFAVAQI